MSLPLEYFRTLTPHVTAKRPRKTSTRRTSIARSKPFGADEPPDLVYDLHHLGHVLRDKICVTQLLRACSPGGICDTRLLHSVS